MLADAGIYLALDANTPAYSLNRENAASLHASYNDVYLQSVFATIDNFMSYGQLMTLCGRKRSLKLMLDQTTFSFSSPETKSSTPATTPTPHLTSRPSPVT